MTDRPQLNRVARAGRDRRSRTLRIVLAALAAVLALGGGTATTLVFRNEDNAANAAADVAHDGALRCARHCAAPRTSSALG